MTMFGVAELLGRYMAGAASVTPSCALVCLRKRLEDQQA